MKSIKTKLIVYFCILILLVSGSFAFISLTTASDAVINEAESALTGLAQEGAKLTESRIETSMQSLETIARNRDVESMDFEQQQIALQKQIEGTGFLALGIVHPDGTTYYQDGATAELGDRGYVIKAFNGESNVSDIITSRVTNSAVLMYAVPIKNNGSVVGVLIGRRDGNALSAITDDMGFGEQGYAYMINGEGTIIAHPDRERVMNQWNPIEEANGDEELKPVAEYLKIVMAEKAGVTDYRFEGDNLYSGFYNIEGTDWIIVITANEEEVLAAIPGLQRSIALTTFIILIISIILCYLIGNSIVKPIIATIEHSKKIASLDITEDVPETFMRRKDEVGSLAIAFQTITDNLRAFIKHIAETAEQVAASSEELTATSQQSATAADEVAKTIEQIAESANEQAKDTEGGVLKTDELSKIIEADLKDMELISEAMKQLTLLKDEGVETVKGLTVKTKNNEKAIQTIYESTVETNESAEKIGEVSKLIEGIAEQTNLLALNAAIEAARAGEAGKGFSVVAEEIRKLAEQSARSVQEIDDMLKKLQNNSQNAVKTMKDVSSVIKEQVESVEITESKFDGIAGQVESVKGIVNKSVESVESMNARKNELAGIMQSLAAIAEENAAGAEEASASVEEQTASMIEISDASEALARLSEEMQGSIGKFKY
ncbi:methyl-accepting chemotaxis sensory transducer [Alkaliphilus metalliredigens QYMF]|uniref:Methyl-accepting chemotaxis sensory transducer n=1 Tax=Alkaliphilus metalliredigens (strain QYMF) TaxID=293826 RepID=A6TSB6_ALKMQ|nr:methyl-accepting chemotaxis protein [Alkaliphilus metalliredigens]ABR49084.1 methyl-accepting chemotaxis sensory transducer [Alkaliphilus metalliredigens QYMF]